MRKKTQSNYKNKTQINNENWKGRKASPRPNFEEYPDKEDRKEAQSYTGTRDSGCRTDALNRAVSANIEAIEGLEWHSPCTTRLSADQQW